MRRAFFLVLTLVPLAAAFRLLSACLDVTPIIVARDGSPKGSGACLACLEEPQKCAGLIEQCQGDPRCKPAFACIVRESCFDSLTLDDKINCALPCAQDAGILSASDPVIANYLVGLVACGQEKCASPCNFSDAAAGL